MLLHIQYDTMYYTLGIKAPVYVELSQISEEYRQRCGGEGETMNQEQFTKLLTSLGYPLERCPQCFRWVHTLSHRHSHTACFIPHSWKFGQHSFILTEIT